MARKTYKSAPVDMGSVQNPAAWHDPWDFIVDLWQEAYDLIWLVVSTPLKNIYQHGNLPQVQVKIKNISNHHLVVACSNPWCTSSFPINIPKNTRINLNIPKQPRDFKGFFYCSYCSKKSYIQMNHCSSSAPQWWGLMFLLSWEPKGTPSHATLSKK